MIIIQLINVHLSSFILASINSNFNMMIQCKATFFLYIRTSFSPNFFLKKNFQLSTFTWRNSGSRVKGGLPLRLVNTLLISTFIRRDGGSRVKGDLPPRHGHVLNFYTSFVSYQYSPFWLRKLCGSAHSIHG
jgi:hypothetical protein